MRAARPGDKVMNLDRCPEELLAHHSRQRIHATAEPTAVAAESLRVPFPRAWPSATPTRAKAAATVTRIEKHRRPHQCPPVAARKALQHRRAHYARKTRPETAKSSPPTNKPLVGRTWRRRDDVWRPTALTSAAWCDTATVTAAVGTAARSLPRTRPRACGGSPAALRSRRRQLPGSGGSARAVGSRRRSRLHGR